MAGTVTRRAVVAGLSVSIPVFAAGAAGAKTADRVLSFQEIERRHGGRLGVAVLDTATGARRGYRQDERFPLCSTFKALAAALVLARVDRGEERLDRRIAFSQQDLVTSDGHVSWSPVTAAHAGGGLTVAELCAAAVTLSDNTAANLLLAGFGGPAALTAYVRSLGDTVTRLDRVEPHLNAAAPGDPRDTTSPLAMVTCLHRAVLGDALSPSSRAQLAEWLLACTTGDRRLRAGLPPGWRVGDKTGTGGHGSTNDVAVVWPPGRAPLVVAVYYTGSAASAADRDAVIARVGRLVSG